MTAMTTATATKIAAATIEARKADGSISEDLMRDLADTEGFEIPYSAVIADGMTTRTIKALSAWIKSEAVSKA